MTDFNFNIRPKQATSTSSSSYIEYMLFRQKELIEQGETNGKTKQKIKKTNITPSQKTSHLSKMRKEIVFGTSFADSCKRNSLQHLISMMKHMLLMATTRVEAVNVGGHIFENLNFCPAKFCTNGQLYFDLSSCLSIGKVFLLNPINIRHIKFASSVSEVNCIKSTPHMILTIIND